MVLVDAFPLTVWRKSTMSEVPIGYKIQKNGLTLEVKQYSGDRAWCYCSACGLVVPALAEYTKSELEEWFGKHIELFSKEHSRERL